MRSRRGRTSLAELLEGDAPAPEPTPRGDRSGGRLQQAVVGAAEAATDRFDDGGSIRLALQRAGIPMRPGEIVVVTALGGIVSGAIIAIVTASLLFGGAALVASPFVASAIVQRRIRARREAIVEAFPDALNLIVASLNAGHTFLRAIQTMVEDMEPALAVELRRVVAECELGDPLPDALGRMAARVQVRDIEWAVQAIRVQQETGGRLADVLQNIAEFMRGRQEVRREVNALTAEGRMSAFVLAGIPVFLVFAVQTSSPGYLDPMFSGWGLAALGGAACSIAVGLKIVLRMVDSIEV